MLVTGKVMAGGECQIQWDNDGSQVNGPFVFTQDAAGTQPLAPGDLVQLVAYTGSGQFTVLASGQIGQDATSLEAEMGGVYPGYFDIVTAVSSNVLAGVVGDPLGIVFYDGATSNAPYGFVYNPTVLSPSPNWSAPPLSDVVVEPDSTDTNWVVLSGNGGAAGEISTPLNDENNDLGAFYVVGPSCPVKLKPTRITFPAKGGSKTVQVEGNGTDCSWTAVSNDPFITIISGSSGTANGKVDYTVSGNTNTTPLTGTMTIAGQAVTIKQAAGGCRFKLSPRDAKFNAAGDSATVNVKPNFNDCAWTAVSNDPFIIITDGAGGVGDGTVSYTVTANTNATPITGTMTIGTETFTVTEAGQK